ncbi:hypothetical protein HK102_002911 [Quaeritorhiza haematococci]|nr:hypothetical protein HK102_002911 [Quaeritorhiza haematococci]
MKLFTTLVISTLAIFYLSLHVSAAPVAIPEANPGWSDWNHTQKGAVLGASVMGALTVGSMAVTGAKVGAAAGPAGAVAGALSGAAVGVIGGGIPAGFGGAVGAGIGSIVDKASGN